MPKNDNGFVSSLDREVTQRGRERQVAALLEEMKVEDQLTELRLQRGLSQAQLAEAMGVKQPVVARIESGRARNLTLATIARTAASLGARVELRLVPITATRHTSRKRSRKAGNDAGLPIRRHKKAQIR
jgi:transcriptional regulator with XRE-family HTH domain